MNTNKQQQQPSQQQQSNRSFELRDALKASLNVLRRMYTVTGEPHLKGIIEQGDRALKG